MWPVILLTLVRSWFLTGDAVYYQPGITKTTTITPDGNTIVTENESKFEGVDATVLYVQKINDRSIKLARSRSDLFEGVIVDLNGSVTDNTFTYFNFNNKPLAPQGIYRKIVEPIREAGDFETLPGFNGMFINGVELLNYKSDDTIFYGQIQELIVTTGGTGYDVVNPQDLRLQILLVLVLRVQLLLKVLWKELIL